MGHAVGNDYLANVVWLPEPSRTNGEVLDNLGLWRLRGRLELCLLCVAGPLNVSQVCESKGTLGKNTPLIRNVVVPREKYDTCRGLSPLEVPWVSHIGSICQAMLTRFP